MENKISSLACRMFFVVSFFLFAVAVLEKLVNLFGYTISPERYRPGRLLEFSAILIVFVVALLLREIREVLKSSA